METDPQDEEHDSHEEVFRCLREGPPSVELDAVHPDTLRQIVREAIEQHIPAGHLDTLAAAEESERTILERMAKVAAR
jgi:DNA-binding NarL/FixJ family response regulator